MVKIEYQTSDENYVNPIPAASAKNNKELRAFARIRAQKWAKNLKQEESRSVESKKDTEDNKSLTVNNKQAIINKLLNRKHDLLQELF